MTSMACLSIFVCALLGYLLPLGDGLTVTIIEQVQALWLLFCSIYAFKLFKLNRLHQHHAAIALWLAAIWWLLLGRSLAWGRDYFPDLPRLYFQPFAVILVLLPIYLLCRRDTRAQMKQLWLTFRWPVWLCLMTCLLFIVAQVIESERMFRPLHLDIDSGRRDLIEELFETPFMFFLFMINRQLYRQSFWSLPLGQQREAMPPKQ